MRELDHKLSKVDIRDQVPAWVRKPDWGSERVIRGHNSRQAGIRVAALAVLAVLGQHRVRSNLELQLFLHVAQRDEVSCGGRGSPVGEESQVALIRGEEGASYCLH